MDGRSGITLLLMLPVSIGHWDFASAGGAGRLMLERAKTEIECLKPVGCSFEIHEVSLAPGRKEGQATALQRM